jgi:hypothetical protein
MAAAVAEPHDVAMGEEQHGSLASALKSKLHIGRRSTKPRSIKVPAAAAAAAASADTTQESMHGRWWFLRAWLIVTERGRKGGGMDGTGRTKLECSPDPGFLSPPIPLRSHSHRIAGKTTPIGQAEEHQPAPARPELLAQWPPSIQGMLGCCSPSSSAVTVKEKRSCCPTYNVFACMPSPTTASEHATSSTKAAAPRLSPDRHITQACRCN